MGVLSHIDITQTEAAQGMGLGSTYVDPRNEGRAFKYFKAGGSNLSRGKLNVAATIGSTVNLSFATAPAVGDRVVSVTLSGAAVTADQFKDGWFVVQDGTGEGRAYAIEGHGAQTSTTGNVSIYLKEKIDTAGALAEANVDLIKNRYDGVVVSVADQADPVAGVCPVAVAANYYGWIQTWGPAAVLMDETTGVGDMLTTGSSVVGAVEVDDAAGEPLVGMMGPQAGVDTEYQLVYLSIDR